MAIWPVYLWRVMYEDTGRLFAIGAVVSWDVLLVDGGAEGWPDDVLIDTQVVIEKRPTFAHSGSLATTPQLSACWGAKSPSGPSSAYALACRQISSTRRFSAR